MSLPVNCAACVHFMRDKIGDGNGLGRCQKLDDYKAMSPGQRAIDKAFKQLGGKPFWPNAERFCNRFEASGHEVSAD